jgi:alkanesulfonate monooxygenase SsuD/methylene tetrahydromethanopterin reductase-like flavin-dependent oxidoreductase (luciferase family)
MLTAIALPVIVPGVKGEVFLEWARKADAGPFSSLIATDRLVYPNFEPLVLLAAAAGVTERIGLLTSVLLAPLRNGGMLAKQAASIDALSGGRLSLGFGVGGREDDFLAAPAPMAGRGKRMDGQIALMRRVWSGDPVSEDIGNIGPPPSRKGGPQILIGGYAPASFVRVAALGDGYIVGNGGDAERTEQNFGKARQAWKDAGRPGEPRLVAGLWVALGPDAEKGRDLVGEYYRAPRIGAPRADAAANSVRTSPETIKQAIKDFAAAGADELVLASCLGDIEQVDRLAEVVG